MAQHHRGFANRARLVPIKIGVVILFVERQCLNGRSIIAIGVGRTAVKILISRPYFLQFVPAFGAIDIGHHFGHNGVFFGLFDQWHKVFPKSANDFFPVFVRGFCQFADLLSAERENLRIDKQVAVEP